MPDSRIEIQSPPPVETNLPKPFILTLITGSKTKLSNISPILLNYCAIINDNENNQHVEHALVSMKQDKIINNNKSKKTVVYSYNN